MVMNEKNYYWEFNKEKDTYELYYKRFYEREIIATIKCSALPGEPILPGEYRCVFGARLNYSYEYLKSTSIEEAKKESEALIVQMLNKKIDFLYYEIEVTEMVKEDFKG